MNKCTEGWPNAPSDVSPDAVDAFLAHVAGCLFHQKALDAEEEKIRSKFRLARGLDPQGRILVGSELDRAVKAHDRNHAAWKQIAKEMNRPFKRIYLSNRGDLVAGSGKFFIFRKYEGNHRLEPEAGLQLWGVIAEGRSIPDVLLGFYPLAGVRHTGQEQFLPLENRYTVGLRIEQLSDDEFNIGFRCVENEILERERIQATLNNQQTGPVAQGTSLRRITETLRWVVPTWKWTTARLRSLIWSFRSEPLSAREKDVACAVLALVFCVGLPLMVWLDPDQQLKAKSVSATEESNKEDCSTDENSKRSNRRRTRQMSGQKVVKSDKADKRDQNEPSAAASGQDVRTDGAPAPNDKPPSAESKPAANAEDAKGPVAWHFQSEPPLAVNIDAVAIHSGYDAALAQKLAAEMRKRDISVRPLNDRALKGNHVAVSWSIIREDKAVTVEATLTADGDSKVLSFRSAGSCPEQACDEAVRTAVAGVFAVMRDLTYSEA